MRLGVLGLWAFTNLEIAYALLRVEERRRAYLLASLANVVLTVDADGRCSSSSSTRARAATSPATTSARRSCCSGCGGRCATASAARPRPARAARPAAALRRADRPGRRDGLRAERRRPRVPAAHAGRGRGRAVRAVGEARDGGHPRGARLSARLAAAGLLDRRRRPRAALLRGGDDVVRRRHGARRRGPDAARPLGRAPARARRSTSRRTRRCRGSRWAGRCTACSSCS